MSFYVGDLDGTPRVDVTVPGIEHSFGTGPANCRTGVATSSEATNASDSEGAVDSDDTDAGERSQNQRLTLLEGGVKHRPSVNTGAAVSSTFPVVRDVLRHDQPRLRYQPERTLPPLWSAIAGWTDLTVTHPVPDRFDAPAGWGQQWTVTYRHGDNNLTAPVASVSLDDLLTADPVRVGSWHQNRTARAGLRFAGSTNELHFHDSLFERKLIRVADFHGATDIVSQPFTLTWFDGHKTRHHTPDFLFDFDGTITVVNTRPFEKLNDRLLEDASAVGQVCVSRGWNHAVVVGYPLPSFTIIDTVASHRDANDHLGYGDNIIDFLNDYGPTGFDRVCQHFDVPVVARAVLQRLIWDREVSVDLNEPLEDETLVALPGEEVSS